MVTATTPESFSRISSNNYSIQKYRSLRAISIQDKDQILTRLVVECAPRVAAKYYCHACPDLEDVAHESAYSIFAQLECKDLPSAMTRNEVENYVVSCYYSMAPMRLLTSINTRATKGICSIEELMQRVGDQASPVNMEYLSYTEMKDVDVICLLQQLGVHEHWLYIYFWQVVLELPWAATVERLAKCGIQISEAVMRKRWSRFCNQLQPAVRAWASDLPFDQYCFKQSNWIAKSIATASHRNRRRE